MLISSHYKNFMKPLVLVIWPVISLYTERCGWSTVRLSQSSDCILFTRSEPISCGLYNPVRCTCPVVFHNVCEKSYKHKIISVLLKFYRGCFHCKLQIIHWSTWHWLSVLSESETICLPSLDSNVDSKPILSVRCSLGIKDKAILFFCICEGLTICSLAPIA